MRASTGDVTVSTSGGMCLANYFAKTRVAVNSGRVAKASAMVSTCVTGFAPGGRYMFTSSVGDASNSIIVRDITASTSNGSCIMNGFRSSTRVSRAFGVRSSCGSFLVTGCSTAKGPI